MNDAIKRAEDGVATAEAIHANELKKRQDEIISFAIDVAEAKGDPQRRAGGRYLAPAVPRRSSLFGAVVRFSLDLCEYFFAVYGHILGRVDADAHLMIFNTRSLTTLRGSLSARIATYLVCRSFEASVHSKNSMRTTASRFKPHAAFHLLRG